MSETLKSLAIKRIIKEVEEGKRKIINGALYMEDGKKLGTKSPKGYILYSCCINGKHVMVYGHRLMYAYYFGKLNDSLVINHIDGDKTNNHPSNLEEITHSKNAFLGKGFSGETSKSRQAIEIILKRIDDGIYKFDESFNLLKRTKNGWKILGTHKRRKEMKYGYIYLGIRENREYYNVYLHQVIYAYFKGFIPEDAVINHIDGNSLNNHPDNLELLKMVDNILHAHSNNLISYKRAVV